MVTTASGVVPRVRSPLASAKGCSCLISNQPQHVASTSPRKPRSPSGRARAAESVSGTPGTLFCVLGVGSLTVALIDPDVIVVAL